MPIRFRCQHCNQLMGIGRKKAGMDVNCPTCNGVLRVPYHDSDEQHVPVPAPAQTPEREPLFERSDFDAYLQNDVPLAPIPATRQGAPAAAGTVWNSQAPNMVDVEPAQLQPMAPPPGIMLSNGLATLLTIGIIFLMALSFSLGLLVGRAL